MADHRVTWALPARLRSTVAAAALVCIVAFVADALVASPNQARAATTRARDLRALQSPKATRMSPQIPTGDTADAPPSASQPARSPRKTSFDPSTSTVDDAETTPTKKVYRNRSDGSHTAMLTSSPVRYRGDDGSWRDIDLTLETRPDGTIGARSARDAATLAPRSGGALISQPTPAGVFSLRHPDATDGAAVISNSADGASKARYARGLSANRDLVVRLTVDGFEEEVVLPDAAAPGSYQVEVTLPTGVTAADKDAGVDFTDAAGKLVATLGRGIAHETPGADGRGAAPTPVQTRLVSVSGGVATVESGIDPAWLADPARVFPVTIDPSFYQTTFAGSGAWDTYVTNAQYANTSFKTATSMYVGTNNGGATLSRSQLWFNLGTIASPNDWVTESHLNVFDYYSTSCVARSVTVSGLASALNVSNPTWNNSPAPDASGVVSTTPFAFGATGCAGAWQTLDTTSLAQRWLRSAAPNYGVELAVKPDGVTDNAAFKAFRTGETGSASAPVLSITYDHQPTAATALAPADTAIVTSSTPTLSVNAATDPDGDPVKYWFKVATGPDAESGTIVANSGWLTGTTWTVPAAALQDGVTYYWHAWTYDGIVSTPAGWARSLKLDLRLGDRAPIANDDVGPVKVNLSNGNLVVNTASPTFKTVGGDLGLSYSYNSQAPSNAGLVGSYYNDTNANHIIDAGEVPWVVRTDPTVSFDWGTGSAVPGVITNDNVIAQWKGWITVPTTASYKFGAVSDDGVKITVGTTPTVVLNRWFDQPATATPVYDQAISLTANTPVPIQIDYYEHTASAVMKLYANAPGLTDVDVPASWLSTDAPALPRGWSVSTDLEGSMAVVSLRVSDRSATVVDPSGDSHTYVLDATGTGYAPPPNEDGVLARNGDGTFTLHADDGMTYAFRADGVLTSATSATDDRNPAAPSYIWVAAPGAAPRLASTKDPASGRSITLQYGGNITVGAPNCPTNNPSGFDAVPPATLLCEVNYWDGTNTKLWYVNGQLGRIEDPGGEITDFAYDASGRITKVRDPLAADAVAATPATAADTDAGSRSVVAYDNDGRVSAVTGPTPVGGSAPSHTYSYASAPPTSPPTSPTLVHIGGLTEPNGFARKVDFDTAGRTLTDADATNKATSATWDAKDQPLSATDAAGRMTTTLYDYAQRSTDAYGPAPVSCFNVVTRVPNGSCAAMPHEITAYDEGMTGLAAAYWPNKSLAGNPLTHTTDFAGGLTLDWGSFGPVGFPSYDNFSARYTGDITLPVALPYGFTVVADDGVRVAIDDVVIIDRWFDASGWSPTVNVANPVAGSHHRIRIDHYEATGNASLTLYWTPPGQAAAIVPGSALSPRYGLETTKTTEDTTSGSPSEVTSTTYANPALGLATAQTNDPGAGHLALSTQTAHETIGPAGNYSRRVSKTMPSGAVTTYGNYAAVNGATPAETRVNPCPAGGTFNQGGFPKLTTGPDPDGAGPQTPRIEEAVYDEVGRVVASRIGTDAWTCITYDARGRELSKFVPAFGAEPARTVTYSYSGTGNNPLVTSVSDAAGAITTTSDVLGRVGSYSDVWSKITTSTYDQAGRLTDTNGPTGAIHTDYDAAGRPTAQKLDGLTVAVPTYSAAGELSSASYPSGTGNGGNGSSLSSLTRDNAGRTTALTWSKPDTSLLASNVVTRSQAGRVVDESVDGADSHTGNNFGYDAAGRLTSAWTGTHSYGYALDPNTPGCTLAPAAGLNTNRTSSVADAVTTTSCYDAADKLVSSTDATVGNPTYDSHGNTSALGSQTMTYDGGDRHLSTQSGGTTVTYVRDATDRIVSRTTGDVTTRFGYSGNGDTPAVTLDASNVVIERTIGLLGGAMLTNRTAGDVWSYPNVHGDDIATADGTGTKQGATLTYDPYGQSLGGLPDNSAGSFDYGWLGQHQRGVEQGVGLNIIEMGARQYLPSIGRFLEVDPVDGGSANDYDYVSGDPVNSLDLNGTIRWRRLFKRALHNRYVRGAVTIAIAGAACSTLVGCVAAGAVIGANLRLLDYQLNRSARARSRRGYKRALIQGAESGAITGALGVGRGELLRRTGAYRGARYAHGTISFSYRALRWLFR